MRPLLLTLLAVVALATAPASALAKDVTAAQVCGANGCNDVPRDKLGAMLADGDPTDPPRAAAPFVELRLTVTHDNKTDRVTFDYLPSLGVTHSHDAGAGAGWLELRSAAHASLDEAVGAAELRPASELAPIVAVARPDDSGALPWWAIAGAALGLLLLLARHGRRAKAMVMSGALRGRGGVLALIVIACVAALGLAGRAQAAPAAPPALQQALDKLVADGVPGTIALQRQGRRQWHAASGVADLNTKRPIRATDRFRIGSITKSFVSTVVLQLVAERRLSLDDSIERWLPGVVPNGGAITVRQLMNHTSGLHDYVDVPFLLQLPRDPLRTWRPLQLVQLAVAHPPLFAPGTRHSYSNTNYILVGMIIAAVNKAPALLQMATPAFEIYRRIVGPLRLSQTSLPLTDPDIHGRHARGYAIDLPPELGFPAILDTTRINPSWAWTGGAMISTLDDVADFHRALFTGRLLRPDQQRALETTVPVVPGADYGLGVSKLQTPCGPAWGHSGNITGYFSYALTGPDGSRQAVVIATRDINTWTDQLIADYNSALLTAFCGQTPPPATARALTVTIAGQHTAATTPVASG